MEFKVDHGSSSKTRPIFEWGFDPMCFSHVKLLAFDLLCIEQVPHLPEFYVRKGRPVQKVEIMGVVVSMDQRTQFLHFGLDDGTGCIPCILWMNDFRWGKRGTGDAISRRAMIEAYATHVKLGRLLRVQGKVSTYKEKLQLTVLSVQEEMDANAETLHWLDCVRLAVKCYNLPPPLPPSHPAKK
ncbi:hypothetical protein O6H91_21G024600 [Diphasiastrum complanatum]|uniref:Uncharacterized protein n=3 Tax=Diphasiastrum complanatum TaxID=34168 RepID=A0ACC2AIP6_DIPCM|nr:hypothetical protein O6H91_21G024600 [Diphasiastrum complanatum]KAJ7517440.1 hypothetical protein O6H91_21G024600 [Diphasiastrum complanatum]KAJ7517441.1 hypothetical protein O6H91_21G024600 [Diphasiastrum complanatum]